MTNNSPINPDLLDNLEEASNKLCAARNAIQQVVFGQDEALTLSMVALLAGGHPLMVGVPGVAKTLMALSIGQAFGLETKRIQCTPDLMPSDILGTEILEELDYGKKNFRFIEGPVFANLLMVDEINRASPRTQAALLQAMQEKIITLGGHDHALPDPFHVIATQNPLEQEGTYPLPEAELDRFIMQIDIPFPSEVVERRIIEETTHAIVPMRGALYSSNLKDMQKWTRSMALPDKLVTFILSIVRFARPETTSSKLIRTYVAWGAGPRASQALSLTARARTLVDGRIAPDSSDILALIKPVFQHRLSLNFAARADGITMDTVLEEILRFAAGIVPR